MNGVVRGAADAVEAATAHATAAARMTRPTTLHGAAVA
jgi:hypothetical protein